VAGYAARVWGPGNLLAAPGHLAARRRLEPGSSRPIGTAWQAWAAQAVARHPRREFRAGKKRGRCVGVTKVGKGVKREILVDRNGTPLAFTLERANIHELKLAGRVLAQVSVRGRGRGRCRTKPGRVLADRAYDSRAFRADLRRRRIAPVIPKRVYRGPRGGRPKFRKHSGPHGYRLRFIVERTFAWLGHERRILVRYDRLPEAYEAFFTLACLKIVLRKFRNHRR
jgi:transposase